MRRVLLLLAAALSAFAQKVDFNREIRPILSDNCFACHGPDEAHRAMGLRLDTSQGAFERKGVIVPGDAARSRLILRVAAEKPAQRMPPPATGKTLSAKQIDLIKRWINEGAEWKTHWAYEPPKPVAPPSVTGNVRNPIDQFVLARLARENLKPSPEADRATLIRRVTLDLTGLPPTPADVKAFLADKSHDAYEKAVDRLLATPQHAERLALQWLDLARYADTHGYHIDSHRDMWPWRDWVIKAFQDNMPFDRFTIEQLAGDLLPNPTRGQKIATGFNRNHMINFEGGAIPEEYQTEYVVDRVETTSTVWMGMTMGCARCHDHKYDPIKQRDFYRMFAFFNTIAEKGLDGREGNAEPFLQLSSEEQAARREQLIAGIESREKMLDEKIIDPLVEAWEKTSKLPDDPRRDLLHHWELDGGFGDSSGRYMRASLTSGTATFVRGWVNGAAELDGESVIDFGPAAEISLKKPFTLALWVRAGGNTPMTLLRRKGLELSYSEVVGAPGLKRLSQVVLALEGSMFRTVSRWERGPWRHLTITNDPAAGGLKIFVDGEFARAEQSEGNPENLFVDGNLEAGNKNFGKALKGTLDDVRIYTRPLDTEEITRLAIHWPIKALRNSDNKRNKEDRARLRHYFLSRSAPPDLRTAYTELADLKRSKEDLDRSIPTTMVMAEMEKPRDTFILARGDYRNKTEKVTPGTPSILPPLPKEAAANRLALAQWLVSPEHPLTARVAVNRYWQMYFGTGLVKTAEDFGSQGEPPSHPELLDWLATEFIRSGWNIRHMQRLIVTSATYRQSSKVTPELHERDPENRLLARASRFRLQAEMVRDNALAASGLLVSQVGGPSVSPYEPAGVWDDLAYGDVFSAQTYRQGSGPDLYRRSMYSFWKRTVPPSSLSTFDAPDREKCAARRSVTNTPLQALVLLNDPTFVEASRVLAQNMLAAGRDPGRRIDFAFERLLARRATSAESKLLRHLAAQQMAAFRSDPAAAKKLIAVGESPAAANSGVAELAAWTMVASTIMNMDEAITRE